ncbi:hypothetical protein [Streptomyces sp. NPDC051000]|uniref:hypothetical protein n=1 Tax=Streptomyces sp. NPDC051000 TaxID=3155520 RepID=UPI0033ED9F32
MSDHAIPEVDGGVEAAVGAAPEAGEERAQAPGTATPPPVPTCAPAVSPPSGEADDLEEGSRPVGDAACLRTLLETAVTRRSVDEVADLVTLLRRSGQVPDAADHALRAAAISRPIEDVIALAVLLAGDDQPLGEQESEPQPEFPPRPQFEPRFEAQPSPGTEEGAAYPAEPGREPADGAFGHNDDFPSWEAPADESQKVPSLPGRGLRWPVAAALVVSALLYLPRDPAAFLTQGGPAAWILLGLAGVCLTLAVLVLVRDRAGVWSATTMTGIALVLIHVLASVFGLDLWGGASGALLPWPTGASMLAAGLTAVLSVTALLYRSDRPQPSPEPPVFVPPEAVPDPLDTPSDLAPELARDAEATAS